MKIIKKPWGQEEIIEINQHYMLKRLTMLKDHRCSLQYHDLKKETIYVLKGILEISYGIDKNQLETKNFCKGENFTIFPRTIHRMKGVETCVYLECSTPHLEDVIRLNDDYNRITK